MPFHDKLVILYIIHNDTKYYTEVRKEIEMDIKFERLNIQNKNIYIICLHYPIIQYTYHDELVSLHL